MPIPFCSIRDTLQIRIIQKLEIKDFRNFRMSSMEAKNMAKGVKTAFSIPHELVRFTTLSVKNKKVIFTISTSFTMTIIRHVKLSGRSDIRFDAEKVTAKGHFTKDFCKELITFSLNTGSTIRALRVKATDQLCSVVFMKQLLQVADVRSLSFLGSIKPEYARALPAGVYRR